MDQAIKRVNQVLETTRDHPELLEAVDHQYRDKFGAVEAAGHAMIAAQVQALSALGLTPETLLQLIEWSKTNMVTLRFVAEERTSFLREEKHEETDPTKRVVTEGGVFGTVTSKIVRTITEYFWKFEFNYRLVAFRGVGKGPEDFIEICSHAGDQELVSRSKTCPTGDKVRAPATSQDVDVTWFLQHLVVVDGAFLPSFAIDRSDDKCRTPRRNPQVDEAVGAVSTLRFWGQHVENYLLRDLSSKADLVREGQAVPKLPDPEAANKVFLPILPVIYSQPQDRSAGGDPAGPGAGADGSGVVIPVQVTEEQLAGDGSPDATSTAVVAASTQQPSLALTAGDLNTFLGEQSRSLAQVSEELGATFARAPSTGPRTVHEARRVVLMRHMQNLCEMFVSVVQFVEDLLCKQLIAAIGKEVTPVEFAEYVKFHNRRLFAEPFRPRPFSYAVRRSPSHSPEGMVSIEERLTGDMPLPVDTVVASGVGDQPMQFPLSAAVNVTFRGERFVHATMQHSFSDSSPTSMSLVAKARQFSSMIVMVGRIASATTFEPKYAAIVQNQDELSIPLQLSTIPTAKEFKDAISSLSPEQQSFAKAFRSMQLASTLFGILVIQIKPQLERVLCLPENSLTKEIQLTQDLMQLFIKYQVPSDLLAFDPTIQAVEERQEQPLEAVKKHVAALHAMIHAEKKKEIEEEKMKAQFSHPYFSRSQPNTSEIDLMEDECKSLSMDVFGDTSADMLAVESFGLNSIPAHQKGGGGGGGMFGSFVFGSKPPPAPMARNSMPAVPKKRLDSRPRHRGSPGTATSTGKLGRKHEAVQSKGQTTNLQSTIRPTQQDASPSEDDAGTAGGVVDYTLLPKALEAKTEAIDRDSPLRPTIIDVGDTWTKKAKAALLAPQTESTLHGDEQKVERDAAFDLLDALSKSGGLELDHASLHVVIAATHCFDKGIVDTVIQDSVNPVDKVERSTLIMASTIHGAEVPALVEATQLRRLAAASPMLFLAASAASGAAEEKAADADAE